ncbi:hypothetical protein fHeYen902_039c [Yersinia phage fHe-Yen9-02]|nr:hypothetical protein fHeYen902_039c [Yersinia phage fHe-Yen9-02]
MHSLSASFEDASSLFAWFTYDGPRGKEVAQRSHKRMIKQGDTYGLKPLKNGTRYTLIFPDMLHVDFPIDMKTGQFLIERSKKLRKTPDLNARTGRAKASGIRSIERQLARKTFDAARFAPTKIPRESVNGADFSNYQWRMTEVPNYKIRHSKGQITLPKNELVGMRFLRESKGGVLINQDGLYLKLPVEDYDRVVSETRLLPIQDWPNGNISVEQILDYKKGIRRAVKRSAAEEREALRLAERAKQLEKKQQAKDLRRADRERIAARQAELDDIAGQIERGERTPTVYKVEEEPTLTVKRRKIIEDAFAEEELSEDLDEEEIELDNEHVETPEEIELGDLFENSAFAADTLNIEGTIGSLFGLSDDAEEETDPLFNLDDVEEPEDDEAVAAKKNVRAKAKGKKAAKALPSVEAAPDEEADDTADAEEVDAEEVDAEEVDADEEEVDAEDEEVDSEDEEVDAEDEEVDSEDEEVDSEDDTADDEDTTDEEDDTSEVVDETDPVIAEDPDVAAAEDEAMKAAKAYAEQNKNTPSSKAAEPEEGDVIRFKADAKLKRDWVILRASSHKASDNIVVYTVYDITNSPDEVRQIRINRARKQSLFDIAEHIKDMKPAMFNQVYDMAEEYEVNKDPISS